jgi:hypothetical protein
MNQNASEPGLVQIPESVAHTPSLLSSTVAFFSRDINSFFPRKKGRGGASEQGTVSSAVACTPVPASVETAIESLVDSRKLRELVFRRDVLDWRDNFHVNLMLELSKLNDAFAHQVHAELADTSLFRKLVSRESDQVLQDSFTRLVRLPLINAVLHEEASLNRCAQKWGMAGKGDLSFDLGVLDAGCSCLHDIGFKPSNRAMILSRSQELILGPMGLAAVFCEQGLQLSKKLMGTRES